MGQSQSELTQYDVEEIMQYCGGRLTQTEVEALYDRFKKLDRGHKGFLSASDFTSIPDLAVNPLATRLARFSTGVNYVSFADLISVFSDRADKQEKLRYMFRVHDMDGDGVISVDDLRLSIQLLGGSSLTEKQAVEAAERVVESVTGDKGTGITKEHFEKFFKDIDISMTADLTS